MNLHTSPVCLKCDLRIGERMVIAFSGNHFDPGNILPVRLNFRCRSVHLREVRIDADTLNPGGLIDLYIFTLCNKVHIARFSTTHLKLRYTVFIGSGDRKSTRLNSSHVAISYAVFCLKKKNKILTESDHKYT